MAYSKIKMASQQPPWWEQVLVWIKDNWFYLGIVGLVWRSIDKTFKFLSEGRDERTKQIVREELESVNEKLDALSDAIFHLKTHK